MLEVNNLTFSYKNDKKVLDNISFTCNKGEFIAVVGNNGAGKSSLIKCINKINKISSGSIYLDGEDLLRLKQKDLAKRVAYVNQLFENSELSLYETVMLGRIPYMTFSFTYRDRSIVESNLRSLDIDSSLWNKEYTSLSGGQKQKVLIARALSQEAKLLLLDEPTSALDLKNQYQVLKILSSLCKEKSMTIVMVVHDLNLALNFCDRFLVLNESKVYSFADKESIDEKMLEDVYGIRARKINYREKDFIYIEE